MLMISPDKPGPVEELRVKEKTENTVTLRWEDPKDDGGCLITGYVVEKKEGLKRAYQREGRVTDMMYQAIALTEGQNYVFRVAAENEVGTGEFAELNKAVAPKSQYGTILSLHCVSMVWCTYSGCSVRYTQKFAS